MVERTKFTRTLSFRELNELSLEIAHNFASFAEFFGCELFEDTKSFYGPCPIHSHSDNCHAFIFYKNTGIWLCNTRGCHLEHKRTALGLIRALLSKREGREIGFQETIDFVKKYIRVRPSRIIQTPRYARAKPIAARVELSLGIDDYLNRIVCPSKYYLDRGFSADVLQKFLVGDTKIKSGQMADRVVVPILNQACNKILGFTCRSRFEKCLVCSAFHNPRDYCTCPHDAPWSFQKWQNNKGLSKSQYLYNLWNVAREKTRQIILVEGPSEVWKLEECGYNNSMAIFGSSLSARQAEIIRALRPRQIFTIMDNDDAGFKAEESCRSMLGEFRIRNITPSKNDLGNMTTQEIKNMVGNYL